MAQPDVITKDIPADGMVGTARVLQVIRDTAAAEDWCTDAESAVSHFLKIDMVPHFAGQDYCCGLCNEGMSEPQWRVLNPNGVPVPNGMSATRFTPVLGTPDFIPTTALVSALKAISRAYGGYRTALNAIGSEILGDLWLGFPRAWATYSGSQRITVEVQGNRPPTEAEAQAALDTVIKRMRAEFSAESFVLIGE